MSGNNICDCTLSHNGLGLSGRDCDCPAGTPVPDGEARRKALEEAAAICARHEQYYTVRDKTAHANVAGDLAQSIRALSAPTAGDATNSGDNT